ncbi:response regulator transcription factor [Micromonospora sp. NPDC050784]|uniref:response regulator transcription factor n=1 Tax=Micromonospora sp. NPDC050784 TaxID=3364281 RepID=UPI0037A4D9B2
MRVLLVEDDVRVSAALAGALRRHGYSVNCATTAEEALAAPSADLVLLDLGLPDRDGLEVCRRLRERHPHLSIIAVTARGEEHERVAGLRTGADDYVVKPFSMAELQARIEAVLRRAVRAARPPGDVVEVGSLRLDTAARQVSLNGREISLTRMEFEVLLTLANRPGVAVTREELLLAVWQTTFGGGRTLEVHIAALRAKLGDPDVVRTVRGVGYRLQPR